MSEKMYPRLLRLYPSSFRKEYEGEALQLIRDRLRDERGLFKRARLWWDLIADFLAGLPRAYLNSYAMPEAASLSPHGDGIPSFKVLDKEPLGRGSILVGGTLSMIALATFGFVLSLPILSQPPSGTNGRMSPIETVMQRLNRAVDPDSAVGGDRDSARSASAGTGDPQARPSAAMSASHSKTSAPLPKGANRVGERDRVVPIQVPNLNGRFGKRGLSAIGNSVANGVTVVARSGNQNSHTFPQHGQTQIPAEQPRLENAASAMIQLFHTHDICSVVDSPSSYDHQKIEVQAILSPSQHSLGIFGAGCLPTASQDVTTEAILPTSWDENEAGRKLRTILRHGRNARVQVVGIFESVNSRYGPDVARFRFTVSEIESVTEAGPLQP